MEKATDGSDGGINKLSDDLLIAILSRTSLEESARASVLARRWRYLWTSAHRTLLFDLTDSATGNLMEKFKSLVNTLVKLDEMHQVQYIEGIVISFEVKGGKSQSSCDSLVYFAMQKGVERFELNLLDLQLHKKFQFPSVYNLVSHYYGIKGYPFSHLRTFRLSDVDVEDEVVHYFLASCSNLEEMSIHFSNVTQNLRVIDPPRLRVLEISGCHRLQSLEISAAHLVSLTYRGPRRILMLEKIPNLRELSICNDFYIPFITEPMELWSYSVQLEKLVLDFRLTYSESMRHLLHGMHQSISFCSLKRLEIFAAAGRTLTVFIPLIMASPQLHEFRIEMSYSAYSSTVNSERPGFEGSSLKRLWTNMNLSVHRNLKVVEVGGYTGIRGEQELVRALIMISPSIERVLIDTEIDYFDLDRQILFRRLRGLEYDCCRRRTETERDKAKESAKQFFKTKKFPRHIKSIVI